MKSFLGLFFVIFLLTSVNLNAAEQEKISTEIKMEFISLINTHNSIFSSNNDNQNHIAVTTNLLKSIKDFHEKVRSFCAKYQSEITVPFNVKLGDISEISVNTGK